MADKPEIEPLVVSIWPGLQALGFRSSSAAYLAVKKGVVPPEAIVEIGKMRRISVAWLRRRTSGGAV